MTFIGSSTLWTKTRGNKDNSQVQKKSLNLPMLIFIRRFCSRVGDLLTCAPSERGEQQRRRHRSMSTSFPSRSNGGPETRAVSLAAAGAVASPRKRSLVEMRRERVFYSFCLDRAVLAEETFHCSR